MKKLEKIRKGLVEVWVFNVNVGVAGSGGDRGGRGAAAPPKATKNCINFLGVDPRLAHLSGHCWALPPPHRKILATPLVAGADGLRYLAFSDTVLRFLASK